MKHIPYRQNPTVIDLSKKSPTTAGNLSTLEYELSNHLNTTYNTYTPVRAFRTGVFCCSKNFLKISENLRLFFKRQYCPAKRGKYHQLSNENGGGENVKPDCREFIKQCAFQKFCNTVLHNEACDAHKELHRHKAKEITFSDFTLEEVRQLHTFDEYFKGETAFERAGKKIAKPYSCTISRE